MTNPPPNRVTRFLTDVAGVSLTIMMLVTVADVFLRNVFDKPIYGSVELVQSTLVYMVFLGIPGAFARGGHVTVDIADHLFDARVINWFRAFARLFSLAFLATMLWTMWERARDAYAFGDTTSDLTIPLVAFWAPMLLGTICSIVALCLPALRDVQTLLRRKA